jgi:hypothetical protein
VNLSFCVLAKPNQLLSIIICLFKRYLFLIKPEDLFDLSGFGSAKAKHAVNIMGKVTSLVTSLAVPFIIKQIPHCSPKIFEYLVAMHCINNILHTTN